MLKIVVCVSGGGTNLQAILDAVDQNRITNVELLAVISNNRGTKALERAAAHHIPGLVISPRDFPDREAFNEAFTEKMCELGPDLVVLAGFLVKIPPRMVSLFSNRIVNIHPSLIPSFCGTGFYGLKVHEAVLARGVKITGATVHFVDEGMDSGPIILQAPVPVLEDDDADSLAARILEQEHIIYPLALRLLAEGKLHIEGRRVRIAE